MEQNNGGSLEIIPTTPVEIVSANAPGWDRARHWLHIATHFKCREMIAQVMVGFELLALQEQLGVKLGQRKPLEFHDETLVFKQLIEKELRIPSNTAYRWARLAKRIRKLSGTLPDTAHAMAVLDRPVTGWTAENCAVVYEYVGKITAGKTQQQLLAAEKRRQRKLLPGPAEVKAEPKPEPPLDYNGMFKKARAGWEDLNQHLENYGRQFTILPAAVIEQQVKVLEVMIMARVLWMKYPTDLQTLETAEDLFRRAVVQIECDKVKRK